MSKAIQLKNRSGEKIYPCPFYPVGSVYISFNSTNPTTFFGGTWERINPYGVIDPEGRLEIKLDAENKIVSFTAKDGSHYIYNAKSETIE